MIKIAIIGTASEKNGNLTYRKWKRLIRKSEEFILQITEDPDNWKDIHLISGGAAWCDHVAIYLYKKYPLCRLTLYFPCKWKNDKFDDDGQSHWSNNPGRLANNYHNKFSEKVGWETLLDISEAIDNNATIRVYNGFHQRNVRIGKCDYLIACTFSKSGKPVNGGIFYTWKNAVCKNKIHCRIK